MANYGFQFKDKNGNNYYPCPFPVGFVVLTTNKVNPSTYWGGTWVQYYGGYIYAAQSSIGQTSYSGWGTQGHTLTTNQIPAHTHGSKELKGSHYSYDYAGLRGSGICSDVIANQNGVGFGSSGHSDTPWKQFNINATHTHSSVGGGKSHSHNIASVDVFAWKRTA